MLEVAHFPAAEFTGVTAADRGPWLETRRTMMTASKVAALFGAHPFTSPIELYADMVLPPEPEPELTLNSPILWGLALERAVLERVCTFYGWAFEYGGQLLRSKKHPSLGATLDGVLFIGTTSVWEGKTTSAWRAKDWNEETGEAPTHCIVQAQSQLLVTGAEHTYVGCLIGGQRFAKVEVEPNLEFHGAIVEATEEFLDRVRRLDPPDPDGSNASARALKQLYPLDDGTAIMLPDVGVDWTRELHAIAEQQARLERRWNELRNLLKKSIGKHTYGILPEPVGKKKCWRWQQQGKSRVLLSLNKAPYIGRTLPQAPAPPTLEETLAASIEDFGSGVPATPHLTLAPAGAPGEPALEQAVDELLEFVGRRHEIEREIDVHAQTNGRAASIRIKDLQSIPVANTRRVAKRRRARR